MRDDLLMLAADARRIPLADNSVQCIVTSPPYCGLRKYAGEQELVWPKWPGWTPDRCVEASGHEWADAPRAASDDSKRRWQNANGGAATCRRCGAWRGAYGLEPTIEMYVAHSVEILRECRRVLRPDGVLFWNLGDSYAAAKGYGGDLKPSDLQSSNRGSLRGANSFLPNRNGQHGLKPKDLCLIPARVALAAQADGWWVRSLIVWAKPNPMPESVTDRPTDAYEHILMLTKSERYFWDADAVREPASETSCGNRRAFRGGGMYTGGQSFDASETIPNAVPGNGDGTGQRNMRNVWTFPTQPYAGAHFATFPEEIPRRAILAATSAKGACVQCGAPWQRVTRTDRSGVPLPHDGASKNAAMYLDESNQLGPEVVRDVQTIGWQPTCLCPAQHGRTVPCVVLDPFGGSGTTGGVAIALRRRAVLLDLAYTAEYAELARQRTSNVQLEAFL
jgi:DNA modification methylase